MTAIADAVSERQREIDRLQAEIKALTDVKEILEPSTSSSRSRRSSTARAPAPAVSESKSNSDAKSPRKRRSMTAAERKAVSARMTAYWAGRRKQAGK